MAAQTIDKTAFDAYFDQLLVEKRAYFKELIKEVMDEKLMSIKSNGTTPAVNIEPQQDKKDAFALEQLMSHFDKILKEDHNLLLQLAQ